MKKLRFFGLLAATVLLAFALVVACSNGSTEPPDGPGPVEPNGPPAYSIPPGGTGPGTISIPGSAAPAATGVRLDKTVLTLKEGATYALIATLVPTGAQGTVEWKATTPANAAVSTNGVVVGVKAGDSDKPVKVQVQAQAKVGSVLVGAPAICEVTVYKGELMDISTGSDLALLGWDLIKEFGANALNGQRDIFEDAVKARIASLSPAEVKDFATAASQAYLSSSVETPCELIGTTLTYYPVGASSIALNPNIGWEWSGTSNIVYPLTGVASTNWPKLGVKVTPSAEVTVIMPKDIGENLVADKLMTDVELSSKNILKLADREIKVGDLAEVGNNIFKIYLVPANESTTKIQLLTVVKDAPSPKNYTLTPSWTSLPAAIQFDKEYSEYAVGPLASSTHTLSLVRNDPYTITAIRITGFPYLKGGETLSTTPPDINTIAGEYTTTDSDAQLSWYKGSPNSAKITNPGSEPVESGKKYYAKIDLKPTTGFTFSPNVAITCVGDDPADPGTEIDYTTGITYSFSDGNITIVLEFTAEVGEIKYLNLALTRPEDGALPTEFATTTASDAGVQSPANVSWTVNGADWIDRKAATATEDVFVATVILRAIDGFEFSGFTTPVFVSAATTTDGEVYFPGNANKEGTPTVTISSDSKTLTLVVTFAKLQ